MSAGQPADSIEMDHATLGPSVAIYDDRRGAQRHLLMAVIMAAGGILGLLVGGNDLRTSEAATGVVLVVAGFALLLYGVTEVRATARRLGTPVRLVVGEGGFEEGSVDGPIAWDEVESIGFEKVGRGQPGAVRVQLRAPAEFAERHDLSRQARLMLRINNGGLYLARGARMPAADVLDLMSDRLAGHLRSRLPAATPAQRIRRRTSRH
jgi:hypothetical protein